jgi:hypothetical protein
MVLFFLAGLAGAFVARGAAYSGRFSTIVIGSATTVTIGAIALAWRPSPVAAEPPPHG